MVAFIDSNSVTSFPSRARPCVRGSDFATSQRPLLQRTSLESFASHSQVLQGKSKPSARRLHRADHSNQQYSILALTDSSGSVVERVAYHAYGQPTFTNAEGTTLSTSAKATRYSYTSREWDPSLELHHFRARWISGATGRFLRRDPIGYLDGSNLYQAYFVPTALDPLGKLKQIDVQVIAPLKLKGQCGAELYASWKFRLPANHKAKGWLIQLIIVNCAVGDCEFVPESVRETTCGPERSPEKCVCFPGKYKIFKYYEAWRVGFNKEVVENPIGMPATKHDDTASYPSKNDTCGEILQGGTLQFYSDSDTGDLSLSSQWAPKPDGFGHDTKCPTTARQLYSFDGKDGAPSFWDNKTPIARNTRAFSMNWKCCKCDKPNERIAYAEAFPQRRSK